MIAACPPKTETLHELSSCDIVHVSEGSALRHSKSKSELHGVVT